MRRVIVLVVLALSGALAGCGGSGSSGARSSGLADKPAKQILSGVVTALGGVRSYHVEGQLTDEDGPGSLSGDVSVAGRSRLRFEQAGQRFQVLVIDATTYLRANDTFWRKQAGPQAARLLGNQWVRTRHRDQRRVLDGLLPRTLASCLSKHHGIVTRKGTGRVGGQNVVVLHDAGEPGGSPGDLYVAASDRPLPLRVVQTGPDRPGKHTDPRCGGDSHTKRSDISLSRFDEAVQITAPSDAIDLDSILKTGGQGGQAS